VYSKDIRPLAKLGTSRLFTKNTSYCSNSFKKLNFPKRTQKGINKKQMQIMAEICQNRPAGKDEFFRRPSVAQIKKC